MEEIESSSSVLETAILPLNYTPIYGTPRGDRTHKTQFLRLIRLPVASLVYLAVRTRLELVTSCVTGMHSSQLNYRTILVEIKGFEPLTSRLSGVCSNHLSYISVYMVLLARIELALKPYHGLVITGILKEHLCGGPNLIRTDILGVKVRYTNRLCYRAIWLRILDLNQ